MNMYCKARAKSVICPVIRKEGVTILKVIRIERDSRFLMYRASSRGGGGGYIFLPRCTEDKLIHVLPVQHHLTVHARCTGLSELGPKLPGLILKEHALLNVKGR